MLLRGDAVVLDRRAATEDLVVTSWITAAELHFGAAKSTDPRRNGDLVEAFLAPLPILGLDEVAAQIYGEMRALLESQGRRLPDMDLLIGSIAAAHAATLVTGNRRHFERIPGLSVEDWIRAD